MEISVIPPTLMNSYRYLAPLVALVGELRHILARKWTNPEWHKQLLPTQPGSLQNGLEPCIPILLEVFQRCSIPRLQRVDIQSSTETWYQVANPTFLLNCMMLKNQYVNLLDARFHQIRAP